MSHDGPFRSLPWPLGYLRSILRASRLLRIRVLGRFVFVHGSSISIGRHADIRAPHGVELGSFISIGKNFTCEADLRIGSQVLVSSNVSVVGKDHRFDDPARTVYNGERLEHSLVEVGDDVLLGFGTIVIGPVRIGNGCIVGAGSVVTRDLPPHTVCAGVPARVIRPRFAGPAKGHDADRGDHGSGENPEEKRTRYDQPFFVVRAGDNHA